nr:MAG TPA: hypothetical protein [Caudoviricetes sp.]
MGDASQEIHWIWQVLAIKIIAETSVLIASAPSESVHGRRMTEIRIVSDTSRFPAGRQKKRNYASAPKILIIGLWIPTVLPLVPSLSLHRRAVNQT